MLLISDAVVRQRAESNETTLCCRLEMSEESDLRAEEGSMKLLEELASLLL